MASTMASTLALSRPSEKFGTHSTSVDIGQKHSRATAAEASSRSRGIYPVILCVPCVKDFRSTSHCGSQRSEFHIDFGFPPPQRLEWPRPLRTSSMADQIKTPPVAAEAAAAADALVGTTVGRFAISRRLGARSEERRVGK